MSKSMIGQIVGVALIVSGILVAIYGSKKVDTQGGRVSKAFTMPSLNAKVLKWVVAIVLVWFGAALVFGGGHL